MSPNADRRRTSRRTSRLKPGKLLARNGAFIADCAITDRSAHGARVRLFGRASLGMPPGRDIVLFDETGTLVWPARLVWDKEREAGLQFLAAAQPVPPAIAERIAGRYYAVDG